MGPLGIVKNFVTSTINVTSTIKLDGSKNCFFKKNPKKNPNFFSYNLKVVKKISEVNNFNLEKLKSYQHTFQQKNLKNLNQKIFFENIFDKNLEIDSEGFILINSLEELYKLSLGNLEKKFNKMLRKITKLKDNSIHYDLGLDIDQGCATIIKKVDGKHKIAFFEFEYLLGKGLRGNVYKVKNIYSENIYALKIPKPIDKFGRQAFKNEIEKHVELRGGEWERYKDDSMYRKKISKVNPIGIQELPYNLECQGELGFLMPVYDGDLISYQKKTLKFKELILMVSEILEGLTYLHNKEFVHNDLHGGNIFYKKQKDSSLHFYIADLGSMEKNRENLNKANDLLKFAISILKYIYNVDKRGSACPHLPHFCDQNRTITLDNLDKILIPFEEANEIRFRTIVQFLINIIKDHRTTCFNGKENSFKSAAEYLNEWNEFKRQLHSSEFD